MQIAFGRVRRKTEPTGPGANAVIFSKIDTYGAVPNRTCGAWGPTMVDFRITFASSASTNPPNPPYQGGIGSFVDVNIFF